MKALARQLLVQIAVVALWIGFAYVVSMHIGPDAERVDLYTTYRNKDFPKEFVEQTIYTEGTEHFIRGLHILRNTSKPKMLILGSSNAEIGFRPPEFQPLFPQYEVHNVAVRESNNTQNLQSLDMVQSMLSPEVLRSSVIVLGIWYGAFFPDRLYGKPGKMPNLEQNVVDLASPFYRVLGNQVKPRLPVRIISLGMKATRSFLYLSYLKRWVQARWDYLTAMPLPASAKAGSELVDAFLRISQNNGMAKVPRRDPGKPPAATASWRTWTDCLNGEIPSEQFDALEEFAARVRTMGATLVLVDLPLPSAFREEPLWQYYRRRLPESLKRMGVPTTVKYVDLQGMVPDDSFRDTVHSRRNWSPEWAHVLWRNWPLPEPSIQNPAD